MPLHGQVVAVGVAVPRHLAHLHQLRAGKLRHREWRGGGGHESGATPIPSPRYSGRRWGNVGTGGVGTLGPWGTEGEGGDGAQGTLGDTGTDGDGAQAEEHGDPQGSRDPAGVRGAQPLTWELGRLLGMSSGCPRSGLQGPVFWNISWARWVTQD